MARLSRRAMGEWLTERARRLGPTAVVVVVLVLVVGGIGIGVASRGSDDAESETGEIRRDGPATGSNERFQALEAAPELPEVDEQAAENDGDADDAGFPDAPDGYVVWAHPVQPQGLAVADQVDGGLHTASWIREGLWESLYRVDADRTYQPELLEDDATVAANSNGTVTISYQLRSGLQWSDGEPLTAEDVAYTHRILMEGCLTEADGSAIDVSNEGCVYPLRDRTGYDLITSFDVVDETRFSIDMAAFYPDWRGLYPQVFAEHAFGDDALSVATRLDELRGGEPLPSSGPLVMESWSGGSLRLAVNDTYHGPPAGADQPQGDDGAADEAATDEVADDDSAAGDDAAAADDEASGEEDGDDSDTGEGGSNGDAGIAGIQINFVANAGAAEDAVAGGEADLALLAPSADLLARAGDDFDVAALPALEYEHLGLNLLNAHLADPAVRQALVSAVGRADLAGIYGDLVGAGVSAEGVGNAFLLPGQDGYRDNQPAGVDPDPDQAAAELADAGYSRGSDGFFSHPDRGSLELRVLTNGGDSIRGQLQETVVEQVRDAGIEAEAVEANGGAFLTEGPFSEEALDAAHSGGSSGDDGLWDLVIFAWGGGPWPGLQSGAFRSQSGANPYGYSSPEFDAESSRCDGLADDGERATCYQDLDAYITTLDQGDDGIVVIPLVERPQFVIHNPDRLIGLPVITDGPSGGPLVAPSGYSLAG